MTLTNKATMKKLNFVVESNLEKMVDSSEKGMQDLICSESVGGNAGTYGRRPCVCTNYYFNDVGMIEYFGNIQSVPEDIKERCYEGAFILALQLPAEIIKAKGKGRARIVETHLPSRAPEIAKQNIRLSTEEYNKQYAFEEELLR